MKSLLLIALLFLLSASMQLSGQVASGGRPEEGDNDKYVQRLLEAPLKHYRGVQGGLNSTSLNPELIRKRLEEASDKGSVEEKAAVKYMMAACLRAEIMDAARRNVDTEFGEKKRAALSVLLDAYSLAPENSADKRLRKTIASAIGRWLRSSRTDWITPELRRRTQEGYLATIPLPSSREDAGILLEEYRGAGCEDALRNRLEAVGGDMKTFGTAVSIMCLLDTMDGPGKALPCAEEIMARFGKDAMDSYPCILEVADVFVKAAPERVEEVFGGLAVKSYGLYMRLYLAAKAVRARNGGKTDCATVLPPILKMMSEGLPEDNAERGCILMERHLRLARDLRDRKECDASIFVCDAAFRIDPERKRKEFWDIVNCKASAHEKAGRFAEARECYGECLKDGGSNKNAKNTAERALRRLDNIEKLKAAQSPDGLQRPMPLKSNRIKEEQKTQEIE